MKKFLSICLLSVLSFSCFAQGYTLMTSLPSKVAKGEKATEGFFIEVLEEVFKRADIPLRVKKGAWVKNQQIVEKAAARDKLLISPLTRTEQREANYDWVFPIIDYRLVFITNDPEVDVSNIEAMKSKPVCVYRESPAEYKLRELGFKKIRTRVQEQKCFQGLKRGSERIMLTHGKIAAEKGYKLVKGKPEKLVFGQSFEEEKLFLAASKGAVSGEDKKKLRDALTSMRSDGKFEEILSQY